MLGKEVNGDKSNQKISSSIQEKLRGAGLRCFIDSESGDMCIPFGGGITIYAKAFEYAFCFTTFESIEIDLKDTRKATGFSQLMDWIHRRSNCEIEVNEIEKSIAISFCISKEDCFSLPSEYFLRVMKGMVDIASHIHLFMMAAKIEKGMMVLSKN